MWWRARSSGGGSGRCDDERRKACGVDERREAYGDDERRKAYRVDGRRKAYGVDERRKAYGVDERREAGGGKTVSANSPLSTPFTTQVGIEVPLICGPMYPCSNPELVAAVSEAGGIGIVQPISLTYVHGHEYREGLRLIKRLTSKPIGFNALIEASSKLYLDRMIKWVDISLVEGVRFFITSLGNPKWVCEKVHAVGGVVYHDVTEKKWAQKGLDGGVDGLIAVNTRAGGHAGGLSPAELFDALASFDVPLVSAGGVGTAREFVDDLAIGYAAVQLGTRFIASTECKASDAYKQAIVTAQESDITLTERLSGIPVAVIKDRKSV